MENRIAVYSPHTAWDAVEGGINDWLASVVSRNGVSSPISPNLINPNTGAGRIIKMKPSETLQSIIETIKTESNLKNVQISIGINQHLNSEIKTVALCAGSGSSVLKDVPADLYVTGK